MPALPKVSVMKLFPFCLPLTFLIYLRKTKMGVETVITFEASVDCIMLEFYVRKVDGVLFGVVVEGQNVVATTFASDESKALQNMQEILGFGVAFQVAGASSTLAEKTLTVMKNVYGGKNPDGEVPLSMERLPAYKQRVLRTVSQIPVGYVASYGGVAEAAGGGARAVGNVMANNPFAPIVPCHRVVTSSWGLGGYGGGLRVKFEFLKREKRGYTEKLDVVVNGRVLRVFPVELVLEKGGTLLGKNYSPPYIKTETNVKLPEKNIRLSLCVS